LIAKNRRLDPSTDAGPKTGRSRQARLPWIIAGIIHDKTYFREAVQPHVDDLDVSYVGPVGSAERDKLLGGAKALLHLISFAEPFGLSVIESLATGTPVIATPLGSMPELLRDGSTGFRPRPRGGRDCGGTPRTTRPRGLPAGSDQPVRRRPDDRRLRGPIHANPRRQHHGHRHGSQPIRSPDLFSHAQMDQAGSRS